LEGFRADVLLNAAAPVLKFLALERGYERLAVFGTIARANARIDSDIDLVVDAPPGTSSFDFIRFRLMLEEVLGREIDLISYGGLRPTLDDDVRKGAILL
jgi:predicted nucleotidyltransferase